MSGTTPGSTGPSRRPEAWADLGVDGSRAADPWAPAQPPFAVYLPRTTGDVVRAVRESRSLGRRVVVRGAGQSSNGLVTAPGGALLLTTEMDRVVEVDRAAGTVTVQPGLSVPALDALLAPYSLALPVVPDDGAPLRAEPAAHTVGGAASVGGAGPTSLRHGLFVDTVEAIEYVDWSGDVRRADRSSPTALLALLAGLGRHGVLTELTLRTEPAGGDGSRRPTRRVRFRDTAALVVAAADLFADPGPTRTARATWLDLPLLGGVTRGALTTDDPGDRSTGWRRERATSVARGGLVRLSSTLPGGLGPGHPVRRLTAFAPLASLPEVFTGMADAARQLRARESCLTSIGLEVYGVGSPYLAGPEHPQVGHAAVHLVVGIDHLWMRPDLMQALADRVDEVCTAHGALRSMDTLSGGAAHLDPNGRYAPPRPLLRSA